MEQSRCPVHPQAKLKRLCKARDRFWGYDGQFIYQSCPECGSWVLNPRPDPQEMDHYYGGYYTDTELEVKRRLFAQKAIGFSGRYSRLRSLITIFGLGRLGAKFGPHSQVLDSGCGLGEFARFFREETGVQVRGHDINPACQAFARDVHGVDVDIGELRDLSYQADRFDLVTSWHCLEHVYDPVAEIKEIFRITKPGGWLQLEVPTPTILAHLFRGRWLYLQAPTHLYHFRPRPLVEMVRAAGFQVRKIKRPWFLSELAGSLFLLSGIKGFAPKVLLRSRPARYKLLSSLFYLLLALDIPITGLMALLGRGGVCRVMARKPE